ncbi:winged helix-turn-helix transcriptional regulator [candidate division WWE3 bacterium]|nr:winged helix-turn-helix transcriptional regulator [candidate division WWE3 bacterium]
MVNILNVSKAMSDKNRIKIMQMLSEGENNVSDVADNLNVEENLASHHLRVLSGLGFLKSNKKGREVFYKLNKAKLVTLVKDLKRNPAFLEILKEAVSGD